VDVVDGKRQLLDQIKMLAMWNRSSGRPPSTNR